MKADPKSPMFSLSFDRAGLVALTWNVENDWTWLGVTLHVGVRREQRQWGYDRSWYDGPIHSFGAGPFFLLCW